MTDAADLRRSFRACLFVDQLHAPRVKPCVRCLARTSPFHAMCDEYGKEPFKWWTAERADGLALPFRVPSYRTPEWRKGPEAQREYEALFTHMPDHHELVPSDAPDASLLSRLFRITWINYAAAHLLKFDDAKVRMATACEVVMWLVTHKTECKELTDLPALLNEVKDCA